MSNNKPPGPRRNRTGTPIRELILATTDESILAPMLLENPHIKLTSMEIARIITNITSQKIVSAPTGIEKEDKIQQMHCWLLKNFFLGSLQLAQNTVKDSLSELGTYCEKTKISTFDFILSTLEDILKENDEILELICRDGVFKVFDIEENKLSSNERLQLRELLFKIAKEMKLDALLVQLEKNNNEISQAEYNLITYERIKLACERVDVVELEKIYSKNSEIFNNIPLELGLSDFDKDFLSSCIKQQFPSKFSGLEAYNDITINSKYEDMLLTCASIKSTKPWFDTVVLNGMENLDELRDLCGFIKDNKGLYEGEKISFILSGKHWISGTIFVKNGEFEVLLIDPLGKESIAEGANFPKKSDKTPDKPDDVVKKIFPNAVVMIPENKIQHANHGCWVHAIDAVRKLQKIVSLPSQLSLKMLRNTQSLSTINGYVQADKYATQIKEPVNKRGLTFEQSVQENIVHDDRAGKKINKRIEYKFLRLKEKVWNYLKNVNETELKDSMQSFTLDAFKRKTLKKSTQHVARI